MEYDGKYFNNLVEKCHGMFNIRNESLKNGPNCVNSILLGNNEDITLEA